MMNKETDTIVRYCRPTQVRDGTILAAAFLLRKKAPNVGRQKDETELSVDRYEHYTTNQYFEIARALEKRGVTLKDNGYLARMPFRDVAKDIEEQIFVQIDIVNDHDSHCLIQNMYEHDEEMAFFFLSHITESIIISQLNK